MKAFFFPTTNRVDFKNKAMIGGTFTAMHLYDNEKFRGSEGTVLNSHYKDRMPNIPYQFGSLDAAYYIHNIGKKESGNVLNLDYSLNYVGQFYLNWESLGSSTNKFDLPTQLSHDFSATYIMMFSSLHKINPDFSVKCSTWF